MKITHYLIAQRHCFSAGGKPPGRGEGSAEVFIDRFACLGRKAKIGKKKGITALGKPYEAFVRREKREKADMWAPGMRCDGPQQLWPRHCHRGRVQDRRGNGGKAIVVRQLSQ